MDKASKANQVRSFLTKVMLVPTEQVEKMTFQWIGIFPNKIEGSPPQVKIIFATSIHKDLVSSNAKKLTGFLKPICPLAIVSMGVRKQMH
uniref:Uncharacterized protein n=1 Tax=Romanomermis culicivorax TaxID=13658 RepID=A0A915HYD7_ROMCU